MRRHAAASCSFAPARAAWRDWAKHRLAVDHERTVPVSKRGLGDQRKPARPVMAVTREQADALSAALDDQAIAVVLDLVEPVGPVRNFLRLGWNAGFKRIFKHDG